MACGIVLIRSGPGACKPLGASCELQLSAACNHRTSAVSCRLGSNFGRATTSLAVSPPQQSDRANRSLQCVCIGGWRGENDRSADDDSWIADFRARIIVGGHAENSSAATIGNAQSADTRHWRDFRARLCSSEKGMCPGHESNVPSAGAPLSDWAHLISTPEVGCVLVATNKLQRHAILKEAVILLLGCADNQYNGIILNKRMPFPAYRLQGVNQSALLDLAGCPKFVGGHLISPHKIHVLSKNGGSRGFRSLLPGLFVGGDAAIRGLMKTVADGKISVQDLKLYVGQMQWEPSIFFAEVCALGWWDVVACSSTLLDTAVPGDLWQRLRSLYLPDPSAVASFD